MDTYTITWENAHGDIRYTDRDGALGLSVFLAALADTPGCDLINIQKN